MQPFALRDPEPPLPRPEKRQATSHPEVASPSSRNPIVRRMVTAKAGPAGPVLRLRPRVGLISPRPRPCGGGQDGPSEAVAQGCSTLTQDLPPPNISSSAAGGPYGSH